MARADTQDVAAASRGVVRVVLIATNGQEAYFVGHGSGFAVTPDKILTNAHVVEMARTEPGLVIGIIPSEGRKSYGGKIIAYSPGNDLALIQIEEGRVPANTFFAGAVTDGQPVVAIGYPGSVDRAQGLDMQAMVAPLSPVKSAGTASTGRSAKQFDTILHTAPMAAGNSGGPLVDDCGRVLGINSFGSVSEGSDAEFGFAVSNREIASFLRQAKVDFARTPIPCKSVAAANEEEARRLAAEAAQQDAASRKQADAREANLAKARDDAERDIITDRENAMALAAVLLALALLGAGGAAMYHVQGNRKHMIWSASAGGVLLVAAVIVFVTRPGFDDIDDRITANLPVENASQPAAEFSAVGENICRINLDRSRVTVSDISEVPLRWAEGGCINGQKQYGRSGTAWNRILVPNSDPTVSVNSFDPLSGTYTVERYLLDAETLEKARALRSKLTVEQCTKDTEKLADLERMQAEIKAILPAPNERLVFNCSKGKVVPKDGAAGQ